MTHCFYPFLPHIFPVENKATSPKLSVIVPVKNEQGNIMPLLAEITAALTALVPFEIIYINDGSTDNTANELSEAMKIYLNLRVITHASSGGQSATIRSGVLAAKSNMIVTLDGDGQNNPADIPSLLKVFSEDNQQVSLGLVAGQRLKRQDSLNKKITSKLGNSLRQYLLRDGIRDTGCGLKLFRRDIFILLPFFDHLHRYIPALMQREGYRVLTCDVSHRSRTQGISNYGFLDRLIVGVRDIIGVMWLLARRKKPTSIVEESRKESLS